MPKETIRSSTYGPMFDVEVRWGRDSSDVQIATVMPPAQTSEAPQNLAQLVASWDDACGDPENPDGARGLYSSLDRHAINELIRVLRKARDQAFGRDE